MNPIPIVLIAFGVIVVIGLLAWLIVIIFKDDDEIKEDLQFGINLADLEEGRAYGNVLGIKEKPGGRHEVLLEPRDPSLKEINDKKKIKNVKILVDNGKMSTSPRGKWSNGKNILWLLPRHATDFPKEFLETEIGKMFAFYVEYLNADNTIQQSLLEGLERQKHHLIKLGEGEATIAVVEQLQGLLKDIGDVYKETKRDKSTSTSTPNYSS